MNEHPCQIPGLYDTGQCCGTPDGNCVWDDPASVDAHAERGGDAKQAPSPMGSAVDAEGSETPKGHP